MVSAPASGTARRWAPARLAPLLALGLVTDMGAQAAPAPVAPEPLTPAPKTAGPMATGHRAPGPFAAPALPAGLAAGEPGAVAAEAPGVPVAQGLPVAPSVPVAQEVPAGPGVAPAEGPSAAAEATSPWAGTLEIYGFAPLRTLTSTTIRGLTADLDLNLGQALRALTGTFSLRGSVEHGRLGLLTDLSYVGVKATPVNVSGIAGRRTLSATVANDQGIYDLALRYRFGDREAAIGRPGAFTVIPYAGVRVVDEGLVISTAFQTPRRAGSETRTFGGPVVQPLLGTQAQVFVAPRLRLFGRGDLGGFGSDGGGDFSANAQVGIGYAIGNSTQLDLSWRYLHLSRDNGATPKNAYTVDQNGVEVGVKFFF